MPTLAAATRVARSMPKRVLVLLTNAWIGLSLAEYNAMKHEYFVGGFSTQSGGLRTDYPLCDTCTPTARHTHFHHAFKMPQEHTFQVIPIHMSARARIALRVPDYKSMLCDL